MKRRIIVIVVAVLMVLAYQNLLVKSENFSHEDLIKVRSQTKMIYKRDLEGKVLAFWHDISLGVDYFKPGLGKWTWVYGGSHSGNYDKLSAQYLPKKLLKDLSLVYGYVVDDKIQTIKVKSDVSSHTAEIIEEDGIRFYFVVLDKDFDFLTVEAYDDDLFYKVDIDNTWLLEQ